MATFDKWDKRFMELVTQIGTWSSCYQENRKIGAVIVKDKRILTTGYNGAPAGSLSCVEKGECMRRRLNIPSGTSRSCAMPSMPSRTRSSRPPSSAFRSMAPRCTAQTSHVRSVRR